VLRLCVRSSGTFRSQGKVEFPSLLRSCWSACVWRVGAQGQWGFVSWRRVVSVMAWFGPGALSWWWLSRGVRWGVDSSVVRSSV